MKTYLLNSTSDLADVDEKQNEIRIEVSYEKNVDL